MHEIYEYGDMGSISSGDVTKIEVMLEEAPDDTVLAGSIPSELDAGIELNSTYPGGKLEKGLQRPDFQSSFPLYLSDKYERASDRN